MTLASSFTQDASGLILGREFHQVKPSPGFGRVQEVPKPEIGAPVLYPQDGHLITIAPTGAGKGVSCVIPALVRHDGPVIAMDLKAENYAATRRHRAERGSKVTCIDPFGAAARILEDRDIDAKDEIAGFNPFDLLPYLSDNRATACRVLAEMIISPGGHKADPFWRDAAVGALAALIDCYDRFDGPSRSISAIVADLGQDVPGARRPGQVSTEVIAISLLEHDPDLMDKLEKCDLTASDAWEAYEDARNQAAGGLLTMKGMIEEAARRAYARAQEMHALTEEDEIGEAISEELLGSAAKQARFCANLANAAATPHFCPDAAERIWSKFGEATQISLSFLDANTLANACSYDHLAENYPLALHHAARTPGTPCQSLAAQPYTADKTWGSILCTLRAELAQFSGRSVARCMSSAGGLDLEALRMGDDISLYLAFPPNRIRSHGSLFRVMVEGLLNVILSRSGQPEKRTLLLLDEIAQLGHLDLLVTAKTLLRGYGVQVWSFWQDISQLRHNYPAEWQTILNNCRVIQVFGKGSGIMTSELSRALDVSPQMISELAPENLLAWIDGAAPRTLRRAICHADEDLRPLCDDGPFAAPKGAGRRIEGWPAGKKHKGSSDQVCALAAILSGSPEAGEYLTD